ncbi:MAG: biopolymer transporter ExbD [Pirellulaceae bacterium]
MGIDAPGLSLGRDEIFFQVGQVMRFTREKHEILEADMTPMIDMTFQLIAFFMLVINFSKVDQAEEIQLPKSDIAKPIKEMDLYTITLNLDQDGSVIHQGQRINDIAAIGSLLQREIHAKQRLGAKTMDEIVAIIRAHEDAETGEVQKLINKCQENELETFRLRVQENK